MPERFWELDAARGAAVVGMIAFHAAFDLNYFAGVPINVSSGFWWLLARAVAATFIMVSGAVLAISFDRTRGAGARTVLQKFFSRAVVLFGLAMAITAATYLFLSGNGTIWFGILHFMAVGSLAALPLLALDKKWIAAMGIAGIAIGLAITGMATQSPFLLWLGLMPAGFYTFDYFPLFPWLGVMLLGAAAGKAAYSSGGRKFSLPFGESALSRLLCFLGRNSLTLYFIHQPLLIGAIKLAGGTA